MEYNWKMKNGMIDVSPYLLFESSADSDDAQTHDHHQHHHHIHHHHDHHNQHLHHRHDNQYHDHHHDNHHHHHHHYQQREEQVLAMDDQDAESWSYDNSFQSNAKAHDHNHHQAAHGYDHNNHQPHGYDHGYGYNHNYHVYNDDDGEEDVDDYMNWGDSKMIGQEKKFNGLYNDSSSVDDKQFWKNCLGS